MIKYICASCKKDMQMENIETECLLLESLHVRSKSPNVYDILIETLIPEDMLFCGFRCLKNWLEKRESDK